MSRFSSFLLTAVLSCGAVLLTDNAALAQHRGGGHGGGGSHHSSGGGHHYGGGGHYYGHSHGYYSHPYNGYYYRSPGFYGYRRYSNYYVPGTSTYIEDEPYYVPDYAEEATVPDVAAEDASPTRLTVVLPESRGTLWIDGLKIDSPSQSQSVEFPDEGTGRMYPHKVIATFDRDGKTVTEQRQVRISGGKSSVVDFTRSVESTSKVPPAPAPENR